MQGTGVGADEEGEAAREAGQLPHVAKGNVHVPEQVLGGGGIRELDQQGIRAVTAQIPKQPLPLGLGEPLALAGAGEKADQGTARMGSSQRTQGRAWPLQQAAKGDGVGRIARYAEQLQGLVGVVALTVRSLRTREDEIPMAIVEAAFLTGLYPGGDEVIRTGGEGDVDPVVVLAAQTRECREGARQVSALQPDLMNVPQGQIGQEGEQGGGAAHQLQLGVGMGAMKLVQEGQQEEVVADAVGAANDQDPAGGLRRGRQCAATGKPAEQGSLQSRCPDPALAVEAAQGIVEVSHTVGLQCWDGVKGASGLLRQC